MKFKRMKVTLLFLFLLSVNELSFGLGNSSGRSSAYLGRSAYKSDGQKSVYNGLGYANGDYQMKHASAAKPIEASSNRGLGLSAWGIIAVMAGGVFLCTAVYYAVLFYPILCKKERKIQNIRLDCCPTAPPAIDNVDNTSALSTPV